MNVNSDIRKISVLALLPLIAVFIFVSYSVYIENTSPNYNTKDVGYVQGVLIAYFFLGICGVQLVCIIPLVAIWLGSKGKLTFLYLLVATVGFALIFHVAVLYYPLNIYLFGGVDKIEWLLVKIIGIFTLFASFLCSIFWWMVARFVRNRS